MIAVARLVVDGEDMVLRLALRERLLARRREVRVPLAAVREVAVEPDWWRGLRGEPRSGRWLPDRFCVGQWRHSEGLDFVAVREHGPVVVVDLWPPAPFARLAVSAADAEGVARTIRRVARTGGVGRGRRETRHPAVV
ncbi:hypothetical protein [Streptomyces sp. NPDC058964]|uniref:hypothetical protein n=1 Tax=Streptomyces sp. NPDC058964 TaxID=3346681 RepID=UPI0036AAEAC8